MSIFIDPNQTFPITVKLKITGKIDDIATSIKILKPDEDGDDVLEIVCDVTGRDFDTMSKILEEATIINAVTGNPMVRISVFCKLILLKLFKSWNLKDSETNRQIPINLETLGKMRYEIVKALAKEWVRITGAK